MRGENPTPQGGEFEPLPSAGFNDFLARSKRGKFVDGFKVNGYKKIDKGEHLIIIDNKDEEGRGESGPVTRENFEAFKKYFQVREWMKKELSALEKSISEEEGEHVMLVDRNKLAEVNSIEEALREKKQSVESLIASFMDGDLRQAKEFLGLKFKQTELETTSLEQEAKTCLEGILKNIEEKTKPDLKTLLSDSNDIKVKRQQLTIVAGEEIKSSLKESLRNYNRFEGVSEKKEGKNRETEKLKDLILFLENNIKQREK